MAISIYAPATIANLTIGFDTLGLAVTPISGKLLGDVVTVADFDANITSKHNPSIQIDLTQQFSYQAQGTYASLLPTDLESNLVYKAYQLFKQALAQQGQNIKPVAMTLNKYMPIGSGLGSSSCSSVASLVALNKFHGEPLQPQQMLALMGQLEGSVSGSVHYDNVAPAYFGGLQLMAQHGQHPCTRLPIFADWYFVVAYPGTVVKTEQAREILPANYSRADVITQITNMANFVHALHTDDRTLVALCLVDKIAEPYREVLLPNIFHVKAGLTAHGALAHGISGSGPTYYAIAPDLATATKLQSFFETAYLQNEQGFVEICQVNLQGATEITTPSSTNL